MSRENTWWQKLSEEEKRDMVDKHVCYLPHLKRRLLSEIKESDVRSLYNHKFCLNIPTQEEYLKHEVLDRGSLIADLIQEKLINHEFFQTRPKDKLFFEKMLAAFYNRIAKITQ